MAELNFLTDSDSSSGAVHATPPLPEWTSSKATAEFIHRLFIQRQFEFSESIVLSPQENARPIATKSNVVFCSGGTVVGIITFKDNAYFFVKEHGIDWGEISTGQTITTESAEGPSRDSWTVPTWILAEGQPPENIHGSLANLRNLTAQIQNLAPLPRSSTLVNLAKDVVRASPSRSTKKNVLGWARRLVKDITGAND